MILLIVVYNFFHRFLLGKKNVNEERRDCNSQRKETSEETLRLEREEQSILNKLSSPVLSFSSKTVIRFSFTLRFLHRLQVWTIKRRSKNLPERDYVRTDRPLSCSFLDPPPVTTHSNLKKVQLSLRKSYSTLSTIVCFNPPRISDSLRLIRWSVEVSNKSFLTVVVSIRDF